MLDCIEFNPKDGVEVVGSVIWLHGLGASGDDFSPLVPHLQLPDVRFIFPHAPSRPVTIYQGESVRAWYDITTLEETESREKLSDVLVSAIQIEQLIEREIERGVPSTSIILMGFSQGAAMALHVGHRFRASLNAVIILSGYLLKPQSFKNEVSPANRLTPYYFFHGTRDLVVLHRRGEDAYDETRLLHRYTFWKDYPVGHELCLEEIRQIRFILHDRFSIIRQQLSED